MVGCRADGLHHPGLWIRPIPKKEPGGIAQVRRGALAGEVDGKHLPWTENDKTHPHHSGGWRHFPGPRTTTGGVSLGGSKT